MLRWIGLYLVYVLGACLVCNPARAETWQSLGSIRSAALAHVRGELAQDGARRDVEVGALDPRLHLAACGEALTAFTPPGARRGANGTVGVRCAGPQAWKIYVAVRVSSRDRVLVANRALPRDSVLAPADFTLVERNVDTLSQGYYGDAAELGGMRLRRPVAAGAVLTPAMLSAIPLVTRGQQVTLEAQTGGVHIRMAGEALAEAALGQRIRVKNLSSERVVEGVVRSDEVVEVSLR
jgi:flagella basal body P-ring formation protein FlgA